MAVAHGGGPNPIQGGIAANSSMRAGDTAAQSDYWVPEDVSMLPPVERPNSFIHVDLSNNQLTGTIPPGIYKMNMFADLAMDKDSPDRAYYRLLDLSNNKLQGVFPQEALILMPVLTTDCTGPCGDMLNLSGNDLYCPTKETVSAVKNSLEAEKINWEAATMNFEGDDCIVQGQASRQNLTAYLNTPSSWVESVPAYVAPGSSSGPSTGAIAGIVIAVLAAAAIIIGLLVWGAKKMRGGAWGARSYRKNELPDYAVNVVGPQGTAAGVV